LASDGGQGVAEGDVPFAVPTGGSYDEGLGAMQIISPERDESEEAEQHGRCSRNRLIGPLTLRLNAEMPSDFSEGDLNGPAPNEPG